MAQRVSQNLSEGIRAAAARYVEADSLESILIAVGIDEATAADASGVHAACDGFLEVIHSAEGKADTMTAIEAMVDIRRAGIPMSAMALSRIAQRHARAVAVDLS